MQRENSELSQDASSRAPSWGSAQPLTLVHPETQGGWMKRGLGIPGRREAGSASERTLDGMTWGITGTHHPAGHAGTSRLLAPGSGATWGWGDSETSCLPGCLLTQKQPRFHAGMGRGRGP